MSRTFCIACQDCKIQLWIGQDRVPLYWGNTGVMKRLSLFLKAHEDHRLEYCCDERVEEYLEFESVDHEGFEDSNATESR